MSSVNKVTLVGNVGKPPEIKTFASGDTIANVSIATSERWTDKETGEKKESTEWHNVVFRGGLSKIVSDFVKKGDKLYIEGSIRTRKWEDKGGQQRYTTEINARDMVMLGGSSNGKSYAPSASPSRASNAVDEDLPF